MSDDPQPTRVALIRHAEADAARGDPSLSARGLNQMRRLCERLRGSGELRDATRLVTSDLERAYRTAESIAAEVGSGGLQIEASQRLREMSWGKANGLSWEQVLATYGKPAGKDYRIAPGAETWNEFEARARSALCACTPSLPGGMTVVVC